MQLIQNPGYNSLLILIWEGSYFINNKTHSFTIGNSPGVQLFHNVRLFCFLSIKGFCFSISCRARFAGCLLIWV